MIQLSILKELPTECTTVVIPVLKAENLSESILNPFFPDGNPVAQRLASEIKGEVKETTVFFSEYKKVYVIGLGDKPTFNTVLSAFKNLAFNQKTKLSDHIALDFSHTDALDTPENIQAAVNGLMLSTYNIGIYKTDEKQTPSDLKITDAHVYIVSNRVGNTESAQRGASIAETQMRVMDLVNSAPNKKIPEVLADWAITSGKTFGYAVQVFDKADCEENNLHALLSVNAGSAFEPRFIIMEYKPDNAIKKIGLVGKGVTFDTGGISIKPASNMHLMKSDMGGAAAVFGAMELAAKLKLPVHLIGIVPSTENMVDGKSTKPGDVIGSYLGKTIEVIDTDAEGRLILADGLAYMKKNFEPDTIIDLATLTGSVIRTLGYAAAGLFTNNDALCDELIKAGEFTGERLWRLPIWEDYKDDLKSDVADLANFSGKTYAGAISAAKFLEVFIDGHTRWAHLDIAGTAMASNDLGGQRVATAFGVQLLVHFLMSLNNGA